MKIIIKHYDSEVSYNFGYDDVDILEFFEKCFNLSKALGYYIKEETLYEFLKERQ